MQLADWRFAGYCPPAVAAAGWRASDFTSVLRQGYGGQVAQSLGMAAVGLLRMDCQSGAFCRSVSRKACLVAAIAYFA